MELRDFLSLFLRRWFLVLAFSFLGLLAALFYNQSRKEIFQASLLLYLKPKNTIELKAEDSQNKYYTQLRIREFSDSLITFLLQPEVQGEMGKSFQVKKLTPQIFKVSVFGNNPDQAKTLVLETKEAIENHIKKFEENGQSFFQLEVLTSSPRLDKIGSEKILNLVVGFLLGFVFSILFVATWIYFNPKQN